ncbi:hypothetical protein ['Camptotheca acuminata' phytoplasma]
MSFSNSTRTKTKILLLFLSFFIFFSSNNHVFAYEKHDSKINHILLE